MLKAGLLIGVFTVIGTISTAIVTAITAAVLAVFATATAVVGLLSSAVVRIVSLPFRLCVRPEPPSPLGTVYLRVTDSRFS